MMDLLSRPLRSLLLLELEIERERAALPGTATVFSSAISKAVPNRSQGVTTSRMLLPLLMRHPLRLIRAA